MSRVRVYGKGWWNMFTLRNNKGQVALWEVALTLCVVAGFYSWYSMRHQSEANTFKDKAQQYQYTENYSGIRLFDFSCARKGAFDQWGKNERTTNSQTNSSR